MHRKDFLRISGALSLMSPLSQVIPYIPRSSDSGLEKNDIYVFSKTLQFLDYEELARRCRQMGFDGVDITVRPDGHVLPEKVEMDLPRIVDVLRKAGLKADMMTTSIADIREPYTEKILKAASQAGVNYYRLGWLKYDVNKSIPGQMESFKSRLKELEQMNEHYKISGGYQNHVGTSVGSPVWDIWLLIKDLNPRWLGCQYDIRHAKAEGMYSWELGLRLLKANIQSLGFKDFNYVREQSGWTIINTPIGEGAIDFKKYVQLVNELGISAPITMHAEYDLGGAEKGARQLTVPAEKVVSALQQDLTRLKFYLGKH